MDYDICLDAAAMLFMIIVAASNARAYVKPTKKRICYIRLIIANLITLIFDIVSTILICNSDKVPISLCMITNSLDFIGIAATVWCYVRYMEVFINEKNISRKMILVNKAVFVLYCIAHIVNLFTGYIFFFDENRVYRRGTAYLIVYIVPLIYFCYGTALMYKNRRNVEKRLYNATMSMVPIVAIGVTLQFTVLPNHLIILFAMTLAIMMIFFNLESPDYEKLEHTMEQLEISRQEADAANRSKSDFLANMSHEIRTPMNSIVGMCELILREDNVSDTVRDYCSNIQNSGRSLLSIINDILDFSKIESGKMELIEDRFNPVSTLNDVVNMAVTRKGEKKIELLVNADPSIPALIVGDEIRIRQIIINLVSNAVKYTNEGYVLINMSSEKTDKGINLKVSVKDTGIGITEENLQKLFSSFQQVDTKKNRSVEGTGLGLAISKQLISLMGGEITVSSEYGMGSEFGFSIPLAVEDERPFISIKNAEKVNAAIIADFSKFDERSVGECYKNIIENMKKSLGIKITSFSSVSEFKESTDSFSHIITGCEEYISDSDLFTKLSKRCEVVVFQNRMDLVELPKRIKRVFRPFYALPLAAVLNGEPLLAHTDGNSFITGFTAPDAKILIVDDNIINLKVAIGLMRPYHMKITTADSGESAVFLIKSKKFDLVFMDHMMPVMDGIEATKIIRSTCGDYFEKLPIIALTANAVNDAKDMFLEAGMNDFLAKPIELSSLDRILKTWLPETLIKMGTDDTSKHSLPPRAGINSGLIFDFYAGICYAGGNAEEYAEILNIFVNESAEKIKYIKELSDNRDYDNYIIEVHALKSSSFLIGSSVLSEQAKELEFAGRDGNFDIIEKKNPALLKIYKEVADCARDYLGSLNTGEDNNDRSDDLSEPKELDGKALEEYTDRIKSACEFFDGDELIEICAEGMNSSYCGQPLRPFFEEIKALAKDFEYDSAAEKTEEFLNGLKSEKIN